MKIFRSVQEALDFLANVFRHSDDQKKDSNFETRYLAVDRSRYFLQLLGSPQKEQKIVHVAGTSGKGSTVVILSQLLACHGFTVGSVTSPHIVSYNERFMINGQAIDDKTLLQYMNQIITVAERMDSSSFGRPHFKTINTAIAYKYFHDEATDYSVVETEMGGLYDETNTEGSAQKVSLITDISYDHLKSLGQSLTSIAYHKAGIMTEKSTNFALWGNTESNQVLDDVAFARNSQLTWVQSEENYKVITITPETTVFNYWSKQVAFKSLELSLLGEHQVRNTSLALRTLEYLAARDGWQLDEQKVRTALQEVNQHIRGRIEHRKLAHHDCYLDVAHNVQKVKALVATLKVIYPNQKFSFVVGFKGTKDFQKLLDLLVPIAKRFIITAFVKETIGVPFEATLTQSIADYLKATCPNIERETIASANEAFEKAFKEKEPIVITGSFYHLAEIFQNSPYLAEKKI